MFESNRDYKRFEKMLNGFSKNDLDYSDGWVTGLEGKLKGNYNAVYIISDKLLKKFKKEKIRYELFDEKKAKEYMNNGSREYFEMLKKNHPEFIV